MPLKSLKDSVKAQFHKPFSSDEELITHYQHDLKAAIKALRYVQAHNTRMIKYWHHHFKVNEAIVSRLILLLGQDSLQFKGIEEYYDHFDQVQAELVIPKVHPKEKQFIVELVFHELFNYKSTVELLHQKVLDDCELHASRVSLRVDEMLGHLRGCLKLIKKRSSYLAQRAKLTGQIEKLDRKPGLLDEKDLKKLDSLRPQLVEVSSKFTKLDEKVKALLPHVFLFLDEFVEDLSKMLLCQQHEVFHNINEAIKHFCEFHGFGVASYEELMDQWELALTPTRLQLESFISLLDTDLVHEEIDDETKPTTSEKVWKKVLDKVGHSHTVKLKDHANGVFSGYLAADPMAAFVKYHNPNANRLETYSLPTQNLPDHTVLTEQHSSPVAPPLPAKFPALIESPSSNEAPPLPARSAAPPLPSCLVAPPLPPKPPLTPKAPPLPPRSPVVHKSLPPPPALARSDSLDSFESIHLDLSLSLMVESLELDKSADYVDTTLQKVYNSAKNTIVEVPVTTKDPVLGSISPQLVNTLNQTSSYTVNLAAFQVFFRKLEAVSSLQRPKVLAKYDFAGAEPGDIAFKKGDTLEMLFDFDKVPSLQTSTANWVVAKRGTRIGFAPGNYLE